MKKHINLFLISLIALFPTLTFALDFKGFLGNVMSQISILPQILLGLAFVFLLYNIMSYIQANDPKQVQEASRMITYSIIGLFVMISVWGLVRVLVDTFQLDSNSNIPVPTL